MKLIEFMVDNRYISNSESKKIVEDSLFTSIYDLYLARYSMNRGQTRMLRHSSTELDNRLYNLIDMLNKFDLIDEVTYEKIQEKIQKEVKEDATYSFTIDDELMLFQYLYEKKKSEASSEVVEDYCLLLKGNGLIDRTFKLYSSIKNKEDVIQLFRKKLIIDIDSIPNSLEEAYHYLLNRIKELDNKLKISDFKFSIEQINSDDISYESAVVRFSCSGLNYISYNLYSEDYELSSVYEKYDNQFFRIFNKVLADINSDFRIMDIEKTAVDKMYLILINRDQYEFLKEKNRLEFTYFNPKWFEINVSKYWNPFVLLSQQQTDDLFYTYDSIKLFKHLSEDQKKSELSRLQKTYLHSDGSILYEMDNFCLHFDWEMFDGEKPYKRALQEFSKITRGDFVPTNIKDDFSFDNKTTTISFDFKGKTYQIEVEVTGDWYSGEFISLIKRALDENNLEGNFYDLPDGGQVSSYIYLTENQYQFIKSNKLMKFLKKDKRFE